MNHRSQLSGSDRSGKRISMSYIDLHADTITMLKRRETLARNRKMINLQELRQSDCLAQCFSAFVPTGYIPAPIRNRFSWSQYKRIVRKFHETAQAFSQNLLPITSFRDIETCLNSHKTGMILTIEDGGVLGNDIKKIKTVYNNGVRLITLTWNHPNAIGFPNSADPAKMEKGLTPFGFLAIEQMEQLGIIIDVSHLSDGGFWDVCKHTKKPFVASHSNARAITNHPRNLTDEMIRAIAAHGGVIGLNFYGKFLSADNVGRISDMVAHAVHIYQVGGEDVLALGSDFDGFGGESDVRKPSDLPKLYEALRKAGIPHSVIEKMWSKNALRVFQTLWNGDEHAHMG